MCPARTWVVEHKKMTNDTRFGVSMVCTLLDWTNLANKYIYPWRREIEVCESSSTLSNSVQPSMINHLLFICNWNLRTNGVQRFRLVLIGIERHTSDHYFGASNHEAQKDWEKWALWLRKRFFPTDFWRSTHDMSWEIDEIKGKLEEKKRPQVV